MKREFKWFFEISLGLGPHVGEVIWLEKGTFESADGAFWGLCNALPAERTARVVFDYVSAPMSHEPL